MALKARYGTNMPTDIRSGHVRDKADLSVSGFQSALKICCRAQICCVERRRQAVGEELHASTWRYKRVRYRRKSRPPKHKLGTLRKSKARFSRCELH